MSMNDLNRQISEQILANQTAWATAVIHQIYNLNDRSPRPASYDKSLRDVEYHLMYLSEALLADDTKLFASYLEWARVLFSSIGLPETTLADTLTAITAVLTTHLPPETMNVVRPYLVIAEQSPTHSQPDHFQTDEPLQALCQQYSEALLRANRKLASQLIMNAVEKGTPIRDIYLHVFQQSQYEIGRLWQMNEISVAQEHFCTAATQMIMSQLYPYLFSNEKNGRRLVVTCVASELHELGARIVADFFEMAGWDTYYLGANMPTRSIITALEDRQADVLAISATMTFHISPTAQLIKDIRAANKRIKILVGGYPFNISSELWQRVGADGYAADADKAVATAHQLLGDSG